MPIARFLAASLTGFLILAIPVSGQANVGSLGFPEAEYDFINFSDLDGWERDDVAPVFTAFRKSCRTIIRRKQSADMRPMEKALRAVCPRAIALPDTLDAASARKFIEENFRPVRVSKLGEREGLLTGYYEPEVDGSRELTDGFTFPLYRRPADLVSKAWKGRRPLQAGFPSTSGAGMRVGKQIVPYHDRAAIEAGALANRDLEIAWLRDPSDAFFIQIQGSARVRLQDGSLIRVNYSAHNGHPYTAIGRNLIESGVIPREEMSMENIRMFIAEMPEEGRELMRQNRAFTFFRVVDNLPPDAEAVGAQGLSLLKDRSIAVDHKLHVYGSLFWIEAKLQLENTREGQVFNRLTIAQDTGSAIVGVARADIYFGAGPEAGARAGRIRNPGRFFMLVPNEIDPVRLAANVPNPEPRPAPEVEKKEAEKKAPPAKKQSKRKRRGKKQ